MKEFSKWINNYYLANFSLVFGIIFSVCLMFFVQFEVENTQNKISAAQSDISSAQDDIQLLEVEWVYLTRPGRLRDLASRYLKDNSYALANQIKDQEKLEEFYFVNYQKEDVQNQEQKVASGGAPSTVIKVSF